MSTRFLGASTAKLADVLPRRGPPSGMLQRRLLILRVLHGRTPAEAAASRTGISYSKRRASIGSSAAALRAG